MDALTRYRDISGVSYEEIAQVIRRDPRISLSQPEQQSRIDPRNGDRVLYSAARELRPHDAPRQADGRPDSTVPCPICRGDTTPIIDIAPLSEGFTFVNENLFPILYPQAQHLHLEPIDSTSLNPRGHAAAGAHFVQWASSFHDRDLHNMPAEDIVILVSRLAALEERLLHAKDSGIPLVPSGNGHPHYGYVGIIKNAGRLVGGSLSHGHMQVVHTNVLPRKIADDISFLRRFGASFSGSLLEENPAELLVKSYARAVTLVPYFMKRPLEAMILLHDESINYLHDLPQQDLESLSAALGDLTRAIIALMPRLGRETAYNLVFHTGPIGGLYVEALPWTQQIGGYEQMGLYLCEGVPQQSARMFREEMQQRC